MAKIIKIPAVGESITEAVILLKRESGDYVKKDDVIAELETDKATVEISAETAGVLSWTVTHKDQVGIGAEVGSIDESATAHQPTSQPSTPPPVVPAAVVPAPAPTVVAPPSSGTAAREWSDAHLSAQAVPVAPIAQSLPLQKAALKLPYSPNEERRPMSKLRRVIADRLVRAKSETAMLTTFNEVDMSAIMEIRKNVQEDFVKKHGVKLGFMSFFVKASAHVLEQLQDVNSFIDSEKGEIVNPKSYDISVAVGTDKGLFVPVLRGCDALSFADVELKIKEFAGKAKEGKLSVDEMSGGSFTITNGGVYGSLLSTPILNAPQSAILGMHSIQERVVVINGKIEIRPMMYLALSYDHRIIDGKEAVTFLVLLKKVLEAPEGFFLEV